MSSMPGPGGRCGAAALRERLAAATYTHAPIPAALIDASHRILLANACFEQTFGAPGDRPCFAIFKGLDRPCEPCVVARARQAGQLQDSEERGRGADGAETVWRVRAVPLIEPDGPVEHVLHLCLDLTRQTRLRQELDQAERLASVGLTIAGLAHTIKNILAGLEGGIYVVNSGLARGHQDRVKGGWSLVQRYIEQVSTLVGNLLSYARPGPRPRETVAPQELLDAVVGLYQSKAGMAGVELGGQIEGQPQPIRADRAALEACLSNLVTNALDACLYDPADDKEHTILIRARPQQRGGIVLEVSDNGMGIEEQDQKKILTAFHTTKGIRGTGLGLLLTRQVVEEHGGRITFTSVRGEGTTFCILLPPGAPGPDEPAGAQHPTPDQIPDGGDDEQEDPRDR